MSETTAIFRPCDALLFVGNGAPFICKLRSLHSGRHSVEGNEQGKFPFFIMWEGDMRNVLGELVSEETLSPT